MSLFHRPSTVGAAIAVLLGLLTGSSNVLAANADIAQVPITAVQGLTKPNIMFILDSSGSMGWDYMPDDVGSGSCSTANNGNNGNNGNNAKSYAFCASQCNGVAFNPAVDYLPPIKADGTAYPAISFINAPSDGYVGGTGTNLSTNFYFNYTGAQTPLNWTYGTTGTLDTTTTLAKECRSNVGSAPGSSVFTQVNLSTASATVQQNYANWYSYYRTRILMMRSSAGRVFQSLGADARIGFTIISDTGVTGNQFLNVSDFDPTQKTSFFNLLYGISPGNSTPLRGALSKVGRYYAKKVTGQTYDPIQYSCQRNFALMTTDGYWNSNNESASYGPLQLTNVQVGDQDGAEQRPMLDATKTANTLADVAEYYWATDLRPDLPNTVPPTADDPGMHQHMNTFTLGLGVRGPLAYDPNYLTQTSGDYVALKSGAKNWSVPSGNATNIDDLWHAAVNGRGQYFSAGDPTSLASSLSNTIRGMMAMTGTGAGASSSSLAPVTGDDWLFVGGYTSVDWVGDVRAFKFTIDPLTGSVTPPANTAAGQELWSAAKVLNARTTPRQVLFNNGGTLSNFVYANLPANLQNYFNGHCTAPVALSQCGSLSANALAKVTGDNLVKYLGGDTSLYLSNTVTDNRVFRTRKSLMGDVINGSPAFVGKPPFLYADAGYAAFVAAKTNRVKAVYAASNDGMVHAFKVDDVANGGGEELWAFVPTAAMPDMWRLADNNYGSNHRYFVDASPVASDIFDGTRWRTILVGGLGGGGRSYYALDVTDPLNPSVMWEFTDANLGLSLGNPVVTKNMVGTWIVSFTSGINNNVGGGDGNGRLYVVNATTGALITTLATLDANNAAVGNVTTPNNLSKINGWTISATNNTAMRFYGGDMLGNMWRFDFDGRTPPPGKEAILIGTATSAGGVPQPITTKPVLTDYTVNGATYAIVSFGTGRMLGLSDVIDTTMQSVYTIKDTLDFVGLGPLRGTSANLVPQMLGANRMITTPIGVDWSMNNGWYVDLNQSTGERIVVSGTALGNGTLTYASMLPSGDACSPSGTSYLYTFNVGDGTVISATAYTGLITGLGVFVDLTGKTQLMVTESSGKIGQATRPPDPATPPPGVLKRASWRELME
ncbi:Tfp pilus assembly protein, tip-associated adhesin PilY1 [Leptothrix ochracea L12]|uniref:Tfp pilus assembly protein, tip-associated adhesin PilY1 n=1 Tax=Leptothrix ochracea L12 TaxID=735332 RepID=I4Z619_9BURK|nr:PilC/PilY family type IV pilus protein [Leptothrix ochracea]EIM31661.1 Tfp pilus assembly protein, tip-associated adhesin PilY1 [Leptothrix ochracea L12]